MTKSGFLDGKTQSRGIVKWNGICSQTALQLWRILTHCDPETFWAPLTAVVAEDSSDARQWHHWGCSSVISWNGVLPTGSGIWAEQLSVTDGGGLSAVNEWHQLLWRLQRRKNSTLSCCCPRYESRFWEDFDVEKKEKLDLFESTGEIRMAFNAKKEVQLSRADKGICSQFDFGTINYFQIKP